MRILDRLHWDTFQGKLFIVLAAGSACLIILLNVIGLGYAWNAIAKTVRRDLQEIAARTAGEINEYVSGKTDALTAMKELLSYPDADRFRLRLMLKRIGLEFNQFKNLALFDAGGRLIVSSAEGEGPVIPDEALHIAGKGKTYRSPMLLSKDNLPYITVAVPLFWQGEVFRILTAEVDILHIWNRIDSIKIGETGRASLLSEEGLFLANSNKSRVLKKENWDDFKNGRFLDVAYAEVPATGWKVIIMQEHKESMRFLLHLVYESLFMLTIGILGAYYASSWLSRKLSGPVEELHKAAVEITKGNFKHRIPQLYGKELSSLGDVFNSMAVSLVEKEKMEKDLAKSEKMAAIGRLAADVAHEINNPLAIMKNYIYILTTMKMKETDPNIQYLRIIDGEIDRMTRIIQQFNDFYKGSLHTSFKEIDLLLPLREVIDFCRPEMEGKGITFDERLAGDGKVMANKDKLKQVFLNLMKNAEEAMPDGGRLTVKTFSADGKINISIADTGMGIKEEDIKKIFDPFFSTKGIKGSGLGLSITYGIVKNFNGNIEVESEAGKGTTFKVMLPMVN